MLYKKELSDKYGNFEIIYDVEISEVPVSVIMSAYNTQREYLSKSIESVLNQTFTKFEFIIINDGADELTSNILKYYLESDSRIKLIIQHNMGLTKSLNRGLILSNAKYIARQDTDDIWVENKLEKQMKIFSIRKELVLLGTYCSVVNENLQKISNPTTDYEERLKVIDSHDIKKALIKFNPFCHSSMLIRRDILKKLGYYNDQFKFSQDYELWVRILKEYEAAIIPEYLTIKIFHSESITGGKRRREQRRLGIQVRYNAMKYFNASFNSKLKNRIELILASYFPEFLIQFFKALIPK